MDNKALLEAVLRVGLTEDLGAANEAASQLVGALEQASTAFNKILASLPPEEREYHTERELTRMASMLKQSRAQAMDLSDDLYALARNPDDVVEQPYGSDEDEQ